MRRTFHAAARRPRFFRTRISPLIWLGLAVALTTSCRPKKGRPWLFVANTAGVVQIYSIAVGGPNNLPQPVQQPGGGVPIPAGAPMALQVVGASLYVVTGTGAIAQFGISPLGGTLTPRAGTISAGGPPYSVASKSTTLYVANRSTDNISVFSIDASGNLATAQTATVDAVNVIQIDTTERFLFAGNRSFGTTGPRVCTHTIQADGTLPAGTGNCVAVNGAPEAMVFSGGTLFVLINASPSPGTVTNLIAAFTVDATTGNLAPRGQPLDVGAAAAAGLARSVDGKFLFLPRQGQFQTITTSDPMSASGTTPVTNSPACVWPPPAAGTALADPRGKALYVADPIGSALGNPQGPRFSAIEIAATGSLAPYLCDATGGKPVALAIFLP